MGLKAWAEKNKAGSPEQLAKKAGRVQARADLKAEWATKRSTGGPLSGRKTEPLPQDGAQTGQFEVWTPRNARGVDAVGAFYHQREFQALFPKGHNDRGVELQVPVRLVHNPRNRHDSNAVEVQASTGLVGYLSHENGICYAPFLAGLQRDGLTAVTTARAWGYVEKDWETGKTNFAGSMRLDLPEPHMLIPANKPPAALHQILPTGSAIQVTGEEDHMPAITPYLNVAGECWVHATIHETIEVGPRSSKALAEVRVDGNTVGRLTPKLSGDMLPTVQFLAGRGEMTCVHAIVKGNSLKAEVVLYSLRAQELPAGWFTGLGTPLPPPNASQRSPDDAEVQPSGVDEALVRPVDGETPPPPLPPAQWYDDPQHVARLRYWDGAQWTDHTAP